MKNEYAFPHGQCTAFESGMTLRDYFAGQALRDCGYELREYIHTSNYEKIAKSCYAIADAMLKARGAE